jgi:hypothetical protein
MKQIKVKNKIGYVSLVGFFENGFPMKNGNYFSLGGFHVLNMWEENFTHLKIDKPEIDAIQFGEKHIVIIDESIPDDYLNDDPCFTGGRGTTPEVNKEIYEFMYTRFKNLKCMCCSSAQYKSVRKSSAISSRAGISLSKGRCAICLREVLLNNKAEVSQEIWDKLLAIHSEAPSEQGMYLAPWRTVTTTEVISETDISPDMLTKSRYSIKEVDLDEFKPSKKLKSRYATKKVNSEFYGIIKIDDLKEENK